MIGPDDIDHWLSQRDWATLYGADVEAEFADLFHAVLVREGVADGQAHLLAAKYAEQRTGDLIRGLEDTTITNLRGLVSQAIGRGDSLGALKKAIREDQTFSPRRAETVARTETATALGQGKRAAAVDQGRDQKMWQANPDACADCQENETGDWLPIDESFPSGDDTIPAHPNCECAVQYRTAALHEED